MKGRKRKEESRATEFREQLTEWKQRPKAFRPSLRTLARELGTTHQLLSHYLAGLDEWRWKKELEQFRVNAKAKGLTVTPAVKNRYLAWLAKIEARQAREAAKMAKWASKYAALLDRVKHLLPNSWSHFHQRTQPEIICHRPSRRFWRNG